jgi:hypothetical protein
MPLLRTLDHGAARLLPGRVQAAHRARVPVAAQGRRASPGPGREEGWRREQESQQDRQRAAIHGLGSIRPSQSSAPAPTATADGSPGTKPDTARGLPTNRANRRMTGRRRRCSGAALGGQPGHTNVLPGRLQERTAPTERPAPPHRTAAGSLAGGRGGAASARERRPELSAGISPAWPRPGRQSRSRTSASR